LLKPEEQKGGEKGRRDGRVRGLNGEREGKDAYVAYVEVAT